MNYSTVKYESITTNNSTTYKLHSKSSLTQFVLTYFASNVVEILVPYHVNKYKYDNESHSMDY